MLCVEAGRVEGRFAAPPSKPVTQRYLLTAAIAQGPTTIRGVEWSDDVVAMARAIQPIANLQISGSIVKIESREPEPRRVFNVMESGFTLRTAVALYTGVPGHTAVLYGGSLKGRPIDELIAVLQKLTKVTKVPGAVLIEGRRFEKIEAEVKSDVSSQYISGLMFLSALVGHGVVKPLGERKSWAFVEATAEVLRKFGVGVEINDVIEVRGAAKSPGELETPGDLSLASFLAVAAAATGGRAEIEGVFSNVDLAILDIFKEMGAYVARRGRVLEIEGGFYNGVEVDLGHNPDLVMPVALAAATVSKRSVIRGVELLKYKESDRVATVLDVLYRLGVDAKYQDGVLYIKGPPGARGVVFQSHGDHRIALMALAAAKIVGGCIDDISPVAKSWPSSLLYF
ncbi:MAG: 3-phosphoshikimate 1-carboxyvinyltransferase [Pyrobaculum sp.]